MKYFTGLKAKHLAWVFYGVVLFLPLGFRTIVHRFTTGFHEYEAVSLYASDFLIFLFFISYFYLAGSQTLKIFSDKKFLTLFLFLGALSIAYAPYKLLAAYYFARLLLLAILALITGELINSGAVKTHKIFLILSGTAIFQSLIGFAQFLGQKSLGLWFLGEPFLGIDIPGSAKIIAAGAPVLRAYGTFPHPNILGAFLILGLLSLFYFWFKTPYPHIYTWKVWQWIMLKDAFIILGIFTVCLGLILTFSRAGWLMAAAASFGVLTCYALKTDYLKRTAMLFAYLIAIFGFLYIPLQSFITPRASVVSGEPAVSYRLAYNEMGLDLIKNNPLGVGLGNQVIYSVKNEIYQKFGMSEVWQWQPIHNIYLMMASEIGILGLVAFVAFIVSTFTKKFKVPARFDSRSASGRQSSPPKADPPLAEKFKSYRSLFEICNLDFVISLIMLLALLGFGLFDHFLWTLQPGRLMLWVTIGILLGLKNEND